MSQRRREGPPISKTLLHLSAVACAWGVGQATAFVSSACQSKPPLEVRRCAIRVMLTSDDRGGKTASCGEQELSKSWGVTVRRVVQPLILTLLPALTPLTRPVLAADGDLTKVVATLEKASSTSDDAEPRLMGRVQPILSLSGEAANIFKRARIAESDGDFQKALRLYDRLTRVAAGYPFAWSNKGNAHVAIGELGQGLDSYRRALEADAEILEQQLLPTESAEAWLVYLNKATTELALNQVDDCIRDLELARASHGQPDVLLFANKGLALERKGNYAEAVENYDNAKLSNPKEVSPWWLRHGLALYQENEDFRAMEVMRKVNAKYPRESEVKAALSTLVYAFGDLDEANKLWDSLADVDKFKYRDKRFLTEKLHWPPRALQTLERFKGLYTPTPGAEVRLESASLQ